MGSKYDNLTISDAACELRAIALPNGAIDQSAQKNAAPKIFADLTKKSVMAGAIEQVLKENPGSDVARDYANAEANRQAAMREGENPKLQAQAMRKEDAAMAAKKEIVTGVSRVLASKCP